MSMGFRFEMRHETVLWLDLGKLLSLCRADPYSIIPDSWWLPRRKGGDGRWRLTMEEVEETTSTNDKPFEPFRNGRGGWVFWTKQDHLERIRFFVEELKRGRGVDPLQLETVGVGSGKAVLREGWHRIAALAFVGRKKVRVSVEAHPNERKIEALRYRVGRKNAVPTG